MPRRHSVTQPRCVRLCLGGGPAVASPEPAFYQLLHAARGVVVVVASGEIDMINAAGLRKALQSALDTAPWVVLDLSGVTFLDSTGLSVLVLARNSAVQMDSRICLAGPARNVAKVLRISGLDQVLAIHGSVQDAIATATE